MAHFSPKRVELRLIRLKHWSLSGSWQAMPRLAWLDLRPESEKSEVASAAEFSLQFPRSKEPSEGDDKNACDWIINGVPLVWHREGQPSYLSKRLMRDRHWDRTLGRGRMCTTLQDHTEKYVLRPEKCIWNRWNNDNFAHFNIFHCDYLNIRLSKYWKNKFSMILREC